MSASTIPPATYQMNKNHVHARIQCAAARRFSFFNLAMCRSWSVMSFVTCPWRIPNSAHRSCKSSTSCRVNSVCYACLMRDRAFLLIHLVATIAKLLLPGGARSIIAEGCCSNISC